VHNLLRTRPGELFWDNPKEQSVHNKEEPLFLEETLRGNKTGKSTEQITLIITKQTTVNIWAGIREWETLTSMEAIHLKERKKDDGDNNKLKVPTLCRDFFYFI
jgi:hypothetical protein